MDGTRELHVDFVSNLNGSSPSDIIFTTLPMPFGVILTSAILPFLLPSRYFSLSYSSRLWIHLLIELLTVVLPSLLSFTLLSHTTVWNSTVLLICVTGFILALFKWKQIDGIPMSKLLSFPLPEKHPPFLTNYRAGMNLATAICILAVDFQIFPRRFAKTETYGFSIMDVGVGTFVIAHGLAGSSITSVEKALSKTFPILLLGFLRLIVVKASNYHEHVTEYGVHWNFFFTLAFVKIVSTVFTTNVRPIVMSIALLAVYEIALKLGLETWILSDYPRNNLISANREGIFSLLGYMAMFYAACELGYYLRKPKTQFKDWFRALVVLVSLCILCWICLQICIPWLGVPSRRLANTTFCLWMLTYNLAFIAMYLFCDLLLVRLELQRETCADKSVATPIPVFREPYLLRFINYNGLVFFLLANVLTGLVNVTFDTIHMGSLASMILLFFYCSILCVSVAGMYLWRFRL